METLTMLWESLPGGFRDHWRLASVSLSLGLITSWILAYLAGLLVQKRLGAGAGTLTRRLIWYPLLLLVLSNTVGILGFDVGILLGAAGLITVAFGFAAQTSAANVISGLFLLGERPFEVGDLIEVDDVIGHVVATDLLSVKLCTFENLMVRLPNEALLKSKITNLSHYPIRRIDIPLTISNRQDVNVARDALLDVARRHPLCMDEPSPLFIFEGFGRSGQQLTFCVWAVSHEFLNVRSGIQADIKSTFDALDIEMPYQQVMIQGAADARAILLENTQTDVS